jgi:ABC-type uncharacterized transport system YnjBCD permease subunit
MTACLWNKVLWSIGDIYFTIFKFHLRRILWQITNIFTHHWNENNNKYVRIEVPTAVVKSSIFWDIKSCSPLKFSPRFAGTLHAICFILVSCLAYFSTLMMGAKCSSKSRLTFSGLHNSVMYQKTEPSKKNMFQYSCNCSWRWTTANPRNTFYTK